MYRNIEWLLMLRVTPLKWVTFIHQECSLFSRFLVFDISLHRLLFYLLPPILLRVTFSCTLQTTYWPLENGVFMVNTGNFYEIYHWRKNLQRMVILLITYMTHLLLTLTANSPRESKPWAIIPDSCRIINQVTQTMSSL